ncbi:raffinose synthase protein Sip1, glycoside hydrolase family 36 protein [Rhodotorula toruloides]|uniref:Raffinose synthase protein Sip1, glycoside hydrolase family 36 protein n=1 Tax=Rhodotorula toruloides TaxID=5286 RepID=A0A511KF42_RHOTO|nr:raffinose synthase protein Sip1, glycoside hydrolase family 36 protein [Rhodotorula toruloides]
MAATGTFDPPLGSRTCLASPSFASSINADADAVQTDEKRIYFSYLPPPGQSDGERTDRVAEIWTNLPLSPSSSPSPSRPPKEWHALAFLPSATSSSKLYTASLPLPEEEGEWEFTYRFRSPRDDGDGAVEWLGSVERNGRIVVSSPNHLAEWSGPQGDTWTSLGDAAERVKVGTFPPSAREEEGEKGEWDSEISPTFPAQLLVLRFLPCRSDPFTRYTVLLPFSTRNVCSALVGTETGDKLVLRCQVDALGGTREGHLAIAWGEEGELKTLISRCIAAARSVLTCSSYVLPAHSTTLPSASKPLGICTWNALSLGGSSDYSASSLLAWLDSLRSSESSSLASYAVKTVLLDDGWQDTETYIDFSVGAGEGDREHAERRALKSFQCSMEWFDIDSDSSPSPADTEGWKRTSVSLVSGYEGSPATGRREESPRQPREGVCVELREVVGRVKERGVERVGVWMTLCGYWHGLHPDCSLADAYTLRRFTVESAVHPSHSGHMYLPAQSDLRTFYDDYFSSLRAAGVDFVKVDDQATVDCLVAQDVGEDEKEGSTPDDMGEYRVAMLEALRAAAIDAFGADGIIHCMAGSSRIWGGSLGIVGATDDGAVSTVRNSDDYFPDAPDSHRWHIALNAFMSLLSSALRFEPDFDMAQSAHEFGSTHIALRAFSSAQVWMSDEPGADLRGWESLLATTKQGVRVLQAREGQVGTVLDGRIGDDVLGRVQGAKTDALKVGLPVASAEGAHIGIWNCLPGDRLTGGSLATLVDSKDVADSLGSVASGKPRSFVLVDPATLSAQQVDSVILAQSSTLPRRFAKPLVSLQVAEKEAKALTVAKLFDVPAASSAKSQKIACLGLLDKTVGLAAITSVEVLSGKPAKASGVGRAGEATGSSTGSSDTSSTETRVSSTSSFSTTHTSVSSSNQPLTRPLSPSDRSTFPIPQGRVAFLLAYFAGFFRSSIVPNSSTDTASSRTPRTELHSLARDILRQPFRTGLFEVRALVSFSVLSVLWIAGWRPNGGTRAIEASPAPANAAPAQTSASTVSHEPNARLRLELEYLSDRLAFYVAPPPLSLSSLRLCLDGTPVAASVLHELSSDAGIVEFQVESAWKSLKGQDLADGLGNGSNGAESEKSWVVEVEFAD